MTRRLSNGDSRRSCGGERVVARMRAVPVNTTLALHAAIDRCTVHESNGKKKNCSAINMAQQMPSVPAPRRISCSVS